MNMADENPGILPDLPIADTPLPPIDNIHASKDDPDFSFQPHQQPPQQLYMGDQMEAEMSEPIVRPPSALCYLPQRCNS